MKTRFHLLLVALVLFRAGFATGAEALPRKTPEEILSAAVMRTAAVIEPREGAVPQTLTTRVKIVRGEGIPRDLIGRELELVWQAPDRLRLTTEVDGQRYALGRDGQEVWAQAAAKPFGVRGVAGVPRFSTSPEKLDATVLPPFKLAMPREQLALLPLLSKVEALPEEMIEGEMCQVLRVTPLPPAVQALKIPEGTLDLWIRQRDGLPVRLGWADGKGLHVVIELQQLKLSEPLAAAAWKIPVLAGGRVETVALGHVTRFLTVALANLGAKIPSLGPANGERRVVATEGAGRLEMLDGTRVLFLKGTPEEMGAQHGRLMRKEVRNLVDRVLYGVGVGSSFPKGRWFFGEIEAAQQRLNPHMDERYLREMDALARAAGIEREEARLANFFPELFHCSGFALWGEATQGGRIYHGRVLDYLKGIGLEQNAVVMVVQPDRGHAWVNVGYAGFVGTVTAMNEKQIAIGEMGGRGEGQWDGKPMAQLLREVMEKAGTLDEAVEILRRGPRTCEYYYVISDGKTRRAVGIAATPGTFEVLLPNTSHAKLPHAIKDAVLMSAGDRYEALAARVKEGFGGFTEAGARGLMKRPVCMNSNIHSVLFAPDTLEFWVANADSQNVASHARFTRYHLAELLGQAVPGGTAGAGK